MDYTFITVPVITSIVYAVIDILKTATDKSEKFLKFVPLIACTLGILFGVIAFYSVPDVLDTTNVFVAIVIGAASGLAATGTNQVVKQLKKTDGSKDENEKESKGENDKSE